MSDSLEPLYFGNYEVLQRPGGGHWLLGEGGYGRTYKAVHRFLQRECALKIIHERYMRNDRQRARFLHEAQTAARLSHRGIAHVYDFGEHDGVFFYAMEFCQGGNLDELSKRRGPMPWSEVADFARQVGDALACAHGAGLLHRDLKPQNVMLASKNRPHICKLIDFGLVKILPTVENDSTWAIQSVEGGFKGNYATASPEQTGEEEDLDERSDLFSFGVILWWMLVGHNPFEGMSNPRLIADRLSPESYLPRLPKELDDSAAAVLGKLLEKRPENRFSTANDLLAALGELEGAARPAPGIAPDSTETTEISPADLPAEPVAARPSFEDSFEVVSTLEDLQAAKFYGCRDGAGDQFTVLIPESDASESAFAGLLRSSSDGARLPCLDYFGSWQAEGDKPVFVFGPVGPLRLLEVLKILGSARLLDLAPMLGRLARGIDCSDREFGLGLELNPHTLRVATKGGGEQPGSWADIDPLSLRTIPSLPGSGEDSQDVSDASTIVTEESMFPMVSQFSALIYRLVSGTAVKHSAYFSSAAYVPAAALSEDGNQLLRSLISGEAGEPGVLEVIRDLAPLEGLSVDFFGLNDEEPAVEPLPVPVPVIAAKAKLEEAARVEAERKAKQEAERKLREEAERKVREEAERKAREEAEAKAKIEAERRAKEEAERKVREQAERKAREEAEQKARAEAEAKAKIEAERRAKEEAERKVREEAERKAREEAEQKARVEAEAKAKIEAERKAKEEAERKVREEAERKVREEAEAKAKKEAEAKAKKEAERKAKEEAERRAKESEAQTKAREEAERKAKEAAERKAREEEKRKAKEEAKLKAKQEAERRKKEAAEKKAREKAERAANTAAAKKAKQEKASAQAVDAKPPEKEAGKSKFPKIIQTAGAGAGAAVAVDDPAAKRSELQEEWRDKSGVGKTPASPVTVGEKRGKPLGLIIGGGVAAVLAIGIGLFFALRDNSGNGGGGNGGGNGGNGGTQAAKFTQLEKLSLAPGLQPSDLEIRAKPADGGEFVSARWRDDGQAAFFDGKLSGLVTVTLRDGLVFEERWSEGSSIVNQIEGSPAKLELGEVRQVFGVPLPGVRREPGAEVEPVRKDWLSLERAGKELPFELVAGDDAVKKRALWLGLIPNSAPGEPGFSPRPPASVAAAQMPEGMELVLVVPGYRKVTRSPGKPLPDPIELRPAAVSLEVKIASGAKAGYPYQSVVLRPEEAGAKAPPAIPAEALRSGRQVPLRSGPYQVEFRGKGRSGEDELLAAAMMVIPPDCPDEGKLLLPSALPGLEVRIEGKRIDFRTLAFKPGDDAGGSPPDLQLGASGLEVKWADLAVKADQATKKLDLAELLDSNKTATRVLLQTGSVEVTAADSLLPPELLPAAEQRELTDPEKAAAAPLVVKATVSGIYQSPVDKGTRCLDFPPDSDEAARLIIPEEGRPEIPYWHNLRAYSSLKEYRKTWGEHISGGVFPPGTAYIEIKIDASGSNASPFFYAINLRDGWVAHWGEAAAPQQARGESGWFEGIQFTVADGGYFETDKGGMYKPVNHAGPKLDRMGILRYSDEQGAFAPWWPMYTSWSASEQIPKKPGKSEPGGSFDLEITRGGNNPVLRIRNFSELYFPQGKDGEKIWNRELKPEDGIEDFKKMVEKRGGMNSILFRDPSELSRAKSSKFLK